MANLRYDFVHKELHKENVWGGTESILAVSDIYKSNVLVVSESESFYFIVFDLQYKKSVCIAYRSGRDHYDSITSITQENVFLIAKKLSNRINEGLNMKVINLDEVDAEKEEFLC